MTGRCWLAEVFANAAEEEDDDGRAAAGAPILLTGRGTPPLDTRSRHQYGTRCGVLWRGGVGCGGGASPSGARGSVWIVSEQAGEELQPRCPAAWSAVDYCLYVGELSPPGRRSAVWCGVEAERLRSHSACLGIVQSGQEVHSRCR